MDKIIGMDMVISNLLMGMTPILFSFVVVFSDIGILISSK